MKREEISRESIEKNLKFKGANKTLIEMTKTMDEETLKVFYTNFNK